MGYFQGIKYSLILTSHEDFRRNICGGDHTHHALLLFDEVIPGLDSV